MRRKDKEITDPEQIRALIRKARVCRLGIQDRGRPYIVPLCFGFDGHAFYFHSARQGKKIGLLRQNPEVSFELDRVLGPVQAPRACAWGMAYESVMGTGRVVFIDDPEDKRNALDCIMAQYSGSRFEFDPESVAATRVFKLEISEMTAKKSGPA